jgi:acetyl esterase
MAHPAVSDLSPALRAYVEQVLAEAAGPERSLAAIRAGHEADVAVLWGRPPEQLAEVRDVSLPIAERTLALRVYRPASEQPLPGLLWLHGGGWAVGSVETHDRLCRAIAANTPCCVVAPDYRLAPEHPFPAAVEDAWAALSWVADSVTELGIDRAAIAVGGDSAGGNLAAVIARRARDQAVPLALQVLVYPATDAVLDSPSYLEYAEGFNLTRERMQWYWTTYLAGADVADPDASPIRVRDLAGVAPALVQTAEHDVLRSEAEAYASALRDAGVSVMLTRYPGTVHGFLQMPAVTPAADQALKEIGATVRATGS